jgi:hypothetical protein
MMTVTGRCRFGQMTAPTDLRLGIAESQSFH